MDVISYTLSAIAILVTGFGLYKNLKAAANAASMLEVKALAETKKITVEADLLRLSALQQITDYWKGHAQSLESELFQVKIDIKIVESKNEKLSLDLVQIKIDLEKCKKGMALKPD